MILFLAKVNKNQIELAESEPITSGSSNVYVMNFEFSDEWAVLERVAVFQSDLDAPPVNVLLDNENRCMIPWEVMTDPDQRIRFGVFGTMEGNVVLPTVWCQAGLVLEGVITGVEIEPPTPDIYQQILAELAAIKAEGGTGGGGGEGSGGITTLPIASDKALGGIKIGAGLDITSDGTVSVKTTDSFDEDNTLPMTAAGVETIVGNIQAILATI